MHDRERCLHQVNKMPSLEVELLLRSSEASLKTRHFGGFPLIMFCADTLQFKILKK